MATSITFDSEEDVLHFISEYEKENAAHFVMDFSKGNLNAEISTASFIRWRIGTSKEDALSIPYDGTPFTLLWKKVLMCHHGRDKGISVKKKQREAVKTKQMDDHAHFKTRFLQQPTKKMQCPALIEIKKVAQFPDFKIAKECRVLKKAAKQGLEEALANPDDINIKTVFHVSLPTGHKYHFDGKMGGYTEPVDKAIQMKVLELLRKGMRNRRDIDACVKEYVQNVVFSGETPPDDSRRRYFPHPKDISKLITKHKMLNRYSKIDQENVADLLEKLPTSQNKYYRASSAACDEDISVEIVQSPGEDVDEEVDMTDISDMKKVTVKGKKLLFVYQSAEMQRLYRLYAPHMLLLDATYRTCRYALPLFFLVVRTNVDYQVVATFVVQQETQESIREALDIIKQWNPECKPKYGMVDFSHEEISALEEVFDGIRVFLCDFHREQAWVRWISKSANNVQETDVEDLKTKLRRIASAPSHCLKEDATHLLQDSQLYKNNEKLRNYFDKTWLPEIKRWCQAYMPDDLIIAIKTNNGVERMNEDLKYGFLSQRRRCSLSELLHTIINCFLPQKYRRYTELNVKSTEFYRKWSTSVPVFLRNRPRRVFKDAWEKYQSVGDDMVGTVVQIADGNYTVQSEQHTSQAYTVSFGDNDTVCSCTCLSFQRCRLLCKHFYAVIKSGKGGWGDISMLYTDHPILNLDWELIQPGSSGPQIKHQLGEYPSDEEVNIDAEEFDSSQPEDENNTQPEERGTTYKADVAKMRSKLKLMIDLSYLIPEDTTSMPPLLLQLDQALNYVQDIIPHKDGLVEIPLPKEEKSSSASGQLPLRKRKHPASGRIGKHADDMRKLYKPKLCASDDDEVPIPSSDKAGRENRTEKTKAKNNKESTFENILLRSHPEVSYTTTATSKCDLFVGSTAISVADLDTLKGTNWLNDKIMQAYLGVLAQEHPGKLLALDCFMTDCLENQNYENWLLPNVDMLSFPLIMLPINKSAHWFILVACPAAGTVTVYDSSRNGFARKEREKFFSSRWIEYMNYRCVALHQPCIKWDIRKERSSEQLDSHNCGVFVLMNAEALVLGMEIQNAVDPRACSLYRILLINRLIKCGRPLVDRSICTLPFCIQQQGQSVQCDKCYRWCHLACSKGIEQSNICVVCTAATSLPRIN